MRDLYAAAAQAGADPSNTAHTNAGTYSSDSWSFTGATNYNDIAATTITDKIRKRSAERRVGTERTTQKGPSHPATVTSITGLNCETGGTVGTADPSPTTQ